MLDLETSRIPWVKENKCIDKRRGWPQFYTSSFLSDGSDSDDNDSNEVIMQE